MGKKKSLSTTSTTPESSIQSQSQPQSHPHSQPHSQPHSHSRSESESHQKNDSLNFVSEEAKKLYKPYLFPRMERDKRWSTLPFRLLRTLFLFVLVIFTVIAPNVGFLFCRLVQIFNPWLGRKLASIMVGWTSWIYWTYFIESGLEIELYGDEIGSFENSICISNHVSSMDFILVLSMALRGSMLGNVKYFAKHSISYIPFVGWGMKSIDMIFLKRDWMKDQQNIKSTFRTLSENFVPVWIVSFLEGTRISSDKLLESIQFQLDRKIPVTTQVMAPRVKGFISTLEGLPDLEYVYDFTFAYSTGVFGIVDWLLQPYPEKSRVCVYVNKIPVKDIPKYDEDKLKEWTYELFLKKDKLLNSMYKGKDGIFRFPQKKRLSPYQIKNWWTVPFIKSKQLENESKNNHTKQQ